MINLFFLPGKEVHQEFHPRLMCLVEGFAESPCIVKKKKKNSDGAAPACLHLISFPFIGVGAPRRPPQAEF